MFRFFSSATRLSEGRPRLIRSLLPFIPVGLIAGFCNGFLGTGGGTVLVLLLTLLSRLGIRSEQGERLFATCLCVMLPLSFFSLSHYLQSNGGELTSLLPSCLPYALPAAIGGLIGAQLLSHLKATHLVRLFALLVMLSGGLLLLHPVVRG